MRKWNFCAGPAVISEEVLSEVQSEIPEYNDIGSSIMEISQQTTDFLINLDDILLKNLLNEANGILAQININPNKLLDYSKMI